MCGGSAPGWTRACPVGAASHMEHGQISGLYGELGALPGLLSAHVAEQQQQDLRICTVTAGELTRLPLSDQATRALRCV